MDFYTLTPATFEEMCFEYAKQIYNKDDYILFHTRYTHDGGKDIETKFFDEIHEYKIWAECKHHRRNIGLEEIGKNVVLVIAHNINKIIFFSSSLIRDSAKKEIIHISRRLNFEVQFLDDTLLKNELIKYPELVNKYFPSYKINQKEIQDKLSIKIKLNEIGICDPEYKNTFYLRDSDMFYTNVFISNTTNHYFSNIKIDWLDDDDNIEILNTYKDEWISEEIKPFSDYLITFLCHVKKLHGKEIEMPNIILSYDYDDKTYYNDNQLPILSLKRYNWHPLQGSKYIEFICNDFANAIVKNKTGLFQYIEIEGKTGCGKSRIINEMKPRALENDYLFFSYDSYNYQDLDIIRRIICDIAGISYKQRNIFYTQEQLEKLIISPKITENAAKIISNFIFKNDQSNDFINIINYISQYTAILIKERSKNKPIIISIDNIQNSNSVFLNLLINLIEDFENNNIHVILITALNTEKVSNENIEIIENYKKVINYSRNSKPNQYLFFNPRWFEKDVITFWMESLKRFDANDSLVEQLVHKFGDNPLEVTMVSDYLKQNSILAQHSNEEWYVYNKDKFSNILNEFFSGFKLIFKNKINAIFEQHKEFLSSLKKIISTLVLFNNSIDTYSLFRIVDSSEAIDILKEYSIIKIEDNIYSFYHDSMYLFFKKEGIYTYKVIDRIINFMQNNEFEQKKLVSYNIYYCQNKIYEYSKLAKEILIDYINDFSYIQAIEFGKNLYNNKSLKTKNIKLYLQCAHLYAFACSSLGKKDESCNIFYELSKLYITNQAIIDIEEICDFFRDAINSQLQSNRFDEALEIIKIYKTINPKSKIHDFLLYNREAVTYLSINKIDKAKDIFEKSLRVAETIENNSKFWTSTTYSDIALMYFYSKFKEENKKKTIEYLKMAFSDYYQSIDETVYRKHEITWHEAFVDILEEQYDKAIKRLSREFEENHSCLSIYEKFRIKNLIALCQMYKGDYKKAINELKNIQAECEVNQHSAAVAKLNNNIGVAYMLLNENVMAYEYIKTAYLQIYLKMYPIVSNYLIIIKMLGKSTEDVLNNLSMIHDPFFIKYCKKVCKKNTDIGQSWTMWNFKGMDYIY